MCLNVVFSTRAFSLFKKCFLTFQHGGGCINTHSVKPQCKKGRFKSKSANLNLLNQHIHLMHLLNFLLYYCHLILFKYRQYLFFIGILFILLGVPFCLIDFD